MAFSIRVHIRSGCRAERSFDFRKLARQVIDDMPDETDDRHTAASPYSTGGGGTRFEHRLGTVLLVRLLTAGPVLALGERAPDRVAFQQSPSTSVDDVVVTSLVAGGTSVRLDIAVRRAPRFIRSDKKTNDLVAALVEQISPLNATRIRLSNAASQLRSQVRGSTHRNSPRSPLPPELNRRPVSSSN